MSIHRVADLLGGIGTLHVPINDAFDVHAMIDRGLPSIALVHLIDRLLVIDTTESIEKAIGMSLRTFQRHKGPADKALSREHSGRAWKFADILAKATEVFGSQEGAEQWLIRPAIGLNQFCPIDLLATPAGLAMVEDFLEQLKYGVYV